MQKKSSTATSAKTFALTCLAGAAVVAVAVYGGWKWYDTRRKKKLYMEAEELVDEWKSMPKKVDQTIAVSQLDMTTNYSVTG